MTTVFDLHQWAWFGMLWCSKFRFSCSIIFVEAFLELFTTSELVIVNNPSTLQTQWLMQGLASVLSSNVLVYVQYGQFRVFESV